ncbi:MAG: histidine phosphatase family protein [Minisyncoccota bacterium]
MNKTNRPSRLILIRHAESIRNKAKKGSVYFADDDSRNQIKGIPDYKIPLTEHGHEQARQTGIKLRELFGVPDYLYHSGYCRTVETATGILTAYTSEESQRIKVRKNHFIRERDSGYAYDMTEEEARTAFPWLQQYWSTFGGYFARPPGGESLSDVSNRVYTFLNMLFRDRADQNIFVVTHGGTLRSFRFLLERWTYDQALRWPDGDSPKNSGVTHYEYDPTICRLLLKNYNSVYWK